MNNTPKKPIMSTELLQAAERRGPWLRTTRVKNRTKFLSGSLNWTSRVGLELVEEFRSIVLANVGDGGKLAHPPGEDYHAITRIDGKHRKFAEQYDGNARKRFV